MKDTYIVNCPGCGTELFASDEHEICQMCGECIHIEFNDTGAFVSTDENLIAKTA